MNLPIALILPYPPSDNKRYYVLSKRLTEETRNYRNVDAFALWMEGRMVGLETITERVRPVVYPYPCNRRRDATNCLKELWDSLQAVKVLKNDHLIDGPIMGIRVVHPSDAVFVEFWPADEEPFIIEKKPLEQRIFDAQMHEDFTGKTFSAKYVLDAIQHKKKITDFRTTIK